MAEPLSPEAYLAIASTVHNAVDSYRGKRQAKQKDKTTGISTDCSKPTVTLPTDELLSYAGLKIGNDGYVQLATDSPAHPRSWSRQRKAFDFGLILFSEFFMSAISNGGTPASFDGVEVLGQRREVGLVAFTTTYLIGQGLGALLFSPYSDKFGRRTLYIGSAFLYSVFCLPVAATSSIAGVFVGRFVTGVISAVPAVTTRLRIEDLFDAEGRMWAFFSWALVTNLGLVVGPIYASYVTASLDWRWPFYLASIIVAVTGILMSFIRESHTSLLLERTVAAIRSHRPDLILRTAPLATRPHVFQPLVLFFTNPTIFLSSLANAFGSALLYSFAVAFALIYAHYSWDRQKTTLIFLFLALGLFFSTLTRFYDRRAIRKSHLTNNRLTPETPLFGLAIGPSALAVGLWWFAWTIPGSHVRALVWPASALSLILTGYGINEYSTVLPRYILGPHSHKNNNNNDATSAFAALIALRALLGAIFPLFTRQMFDNLGTNVAGSIFAAIATTFCFLLVIFLKWNGRASSAPNAIGSDSDADESAQQKGEEEKKPKPKKTVRFWDDEGTDSSSGTGTDLSDSKTSDERTECASSAGSDLSSTDTVVVGTDAVDPKAQHQTVPVPVPDDDASSVYGDRSASESATTTSTTALGTDLLGGGAGEAAAGSNITRTYHQRGKAFRHHQRTERRAGIDDTDTDTGPVGSLGLNLDLERAAGFPYL